MAESYISVWLAVFGTILLNFAHSDDSRCGFVVESVRRECGYPGVVRAECLAQGCCWDERAVNFKKRCYIPGCAPGRFGWGCRFPCHCADPTTPCDPITGRCPDECPDGRWGVGCLLDNDCTYNDDRGSSYMGRKTTTEKGHTCSSWKKQRHYPAHHFPDNDLVISENFCRNPRPVDQRTWCYYRLEPKRDWDYCSLRPCECHFGRYGVNCEKECHCLDPNEACDPRNGRCPSGCDHRWTGPSCQECSRGRFGDLCLKECHCYNPTDTCHNVTGHCESGCARGWTGQDCQTECADGTYGLDCLYKCNCQNATEACNKQSGDCRSGCKKGFSGRGCQIQCRCRDSSERCTAGDSRCVSGCADGWAGERCHIEIPRLSRPPTIRARDQRSVTLEWHTWKRGRDRGDGPVVGYYIYYRSLNTTEAWHKERVETYTANELQTYTVSGLDSGQTYAFQVAPIHQQDLEGYPTPQVVKATCAKPSQGPVDMRIVERRQGRTTMEDGASEDESHYHHSSHVRLDVQWEVPPQSTWGCDNLRHYRLYRQPPDQPHFTFWKTTDINKVMIHHVSIFANYSVGVTITNNADAESDMTVATFVGRPSGVRNLVVEKATPTSLLLTWQPPEDSNGRVLYYMVRHKEVRIADCDVERSSWSAIKQVDAATTRVELTGLHAYSKYQYRVRAVTEMGRGRAVTDVALTEATLPALAVTDVLQLSLNPTEVRYQWETVECEERGGISQGFQYELREVEGDVIVQQDQTSASDKQVHLVGLTPYTQYAFRVRFLNHVGAGPYSAPDTFRSLSDKPPAPRSLQIRVKTATSLTIAWQPPDPPHGLLTAYEVQYWSRQNLGRPVLDKMSTRHLEYEMNNLHANTSFGIQVRAYTQVGPGPWSDVMYGFTDEGAPDPPHNFRNISRRVDSLSFTWEAPRKQNGILREYKIRCTPLTYLGQHLPQARDRVGVVKASTRTFIVSDLEPGTQYSCSLRASTSKGFGEGATGVFWTMPKKPLPPEPPIIEADKSTDKSIVVILKPTGGLPRKSAVAKSMNQVIVERLSRGDRARRDTAGKTAMAGSRSAAGGGGEWPCNLTSGRLLDHEAAARLGMPCYVTAGLDVTVEQVFVIGDNRTYGGFHNAPLQTGIEYDVWYGVVIDVDGVVAASYSKSETPAVAAYIAKPPPTEATMLLAGVGVAAMVAVVCLIILVALLIARRQRHARSERMELIIANKSPLDGAPARPPRKCDNNGTAHKGGLPDVCSGSTSDLTLAAAVVAGGASGGAAETEPLYGNAGQEQQIHVPISVENLWNYVKEKKNCKTDGFRQEYEELPMGLKAKCEVARKPENKMKNRYGNIVAYDHSRAVLECLPADPHSDYINADYIDAYRKPSAFIATQGPSKHTLNDIWRLAWQENSRRIVMVTNLVEDGRNERRPRRNPAQAEESAETGGWPGEYSRPYPSDPRFHDNATLEHKCEHYWPDSEPRLYGDIWVEMITQEQLADFTIRTFHLSKDGEDKTLRQFHFTAWPDHGVPAYATSLLAFRKKVRSYDDPSAGPTIVHCSAGVGRTGTFIALDYLLDQAKVEGQVDVYNCAQLMRSNRVNMIQTQEQYVFVYDALLEALKCGDTSIPCVDFRRRYADMHSKVSPETGKVRLQEEFELLGIMSPPLDSTTCRDALDPENIHKNRYTHIVPLDDMSRAYLVTYTPGGTDYINAVFVDGYRQRDAFIVTQMPLPHTIMDFWVMIFDHSCKTIIMMNELDPKDETCACYWPEEAEPYEYGPITVELKNTDNSRSDIIIRDFIITMKRKGKKDSEPHTVRQFQYLGWPRDLPIPANKSSVITLINLVEKWQQRSGNHVIAVHCMDGATQSGVFCATSYMLERLKVEQEVDVFQSTKHVRINRPHLVPNMDQYRFLYDMAIEYMDCFDAYANFK